MARGRFVSPMDKVRTTGRGSSGTTYTYRSQLEAEKKAAGVEGATARARMMGLDTSNAGVTKMGRGGNDLRPKVSQSKLQSDVAQLNQEADKLELGARQMEEIRAKAQEANQARMRAGRRNQVRRSLVDAGVQQGILGPTGTLG